jgi:hypothetical protein
MNLKTLSIITSSIITSSIINLVFQPATIDKNVLATAPSRPRHKVNTVLSKVVTYS